MPELSPDAALFAALVAARPRAEPPPDGMAELVLQLAASIRHVGALLRHASDALAEGGIARLPDLLAQAEDASREQAACARGLLDALARAEGRRAA